MNKPKKQPLTHILFLVVGVVFIWIGFAAQADAIYGRDRFGSWWTGGIYTVFGSMIVGAVATYVFRGRKK